MKDESAREGDSGGESSPLLLTRADCAKLLCMSLRHFLRYVARELPAIRTGRRCHFARVDVEAWIEAKRREADGPLPPLPSRLEKQLRLRVSTRE